jgi:hypothetical protein
MATTYWLVGRRIVAQEQKGAARAVYGERLLERLAHDLSRRFGWGFSQRNLEQMQAFYVVANSADSACEITCGGRY